MPTVAELVNVILEFVACLGITQYIQAALWFAYVLFCVVLLVKLRR